MEWFESIKYIRTAQDNNRLVIFVGAGVSKNSGLPSWADLINAIATEIGYHHDDSCNDCEKRSKDCPKVQCGVQQFFTQDEFLRIPEYYYQSHSEDNHKEYYKFIQEKLQSEQKSNPIDNVIFNLLPHHIITTNYDSLLESSENSFTNLYQVISEDKDLLSKPNDRYIIKMHGDLDSPESIVLKESDYIEYEHKHPLISTFIRALLVNHTFLFLGYSLNDYNLNLIIGWINYFQNRYGIEDRPKSFLIVNKTPSVHERLRQKSKNIYIIDLSHFPEAVLKKVDVPQSLSNAIGKNLYAYLHALYEPKILESFIPLEKVLEEKYIALNSYNRISQYDFIHTLRLGRTFFASTELVFYDEDWYDRVEAIIHSGNSGITNYFHKAGITAIHSFQSDSVCLISSQNVCKDVWFEQYLENDYLLLQKTLETDNNASRKIYYYHLLANTTIDMNQLIDQMYLELSPSDYVSVLLSKMRERLAKLSIFDRQETLTREIEHLFATAPEKYRNSIGYLKMLFESSSKLILEMQSLLEKQEKRNKYGRNGWESGHAFTHIWKLQAMAYDYYFFFKCNYLPLDYFSDVNSFLCYYLQAILCSYTPVATEESDSVFGITTDHKRYPLNDIDLDMITKYVDTKTLKDWMKKYYVHSIEVLDSGTAIVSKYNHLCESFVHIGNAKWVSCIMNFTIIMPQSQILWDD